MTQRDLSVTMRIRTISQMRNRVVARPRGKESAGFEAGRGTVTGKPLSPYSRSGGATARRSGHGGGA